MGSLVQEFDKNQLLLDAAWYVVRPYTANWDYSFGQRDESGRWHTPLAANTNNSLSRLRIRGKIGRLRNFGRKEYQSHLNEEATYYYRSTYNAPMVAGYGRGSQWKGQAFCELLEVDQCRTEKEGELQFLFCVDIDTHAGQADGVDCAAFVSRMFDGDAYVEPSTNGGGWHVYVKVVANREKKGVKAENAKFILNHFGDFIESEFRKNGLTCTVDMCGMPTLLEAKKHSTEKKFTRGQAGKIPRFLGKGDDIYDRLNRVYQFQHMAYITVEAIAKKMDDAKFVPDNMKKFVEPEASAAKVDVAAVQVEGNDDEIQSKKKPGRHRPSITLATVCAEKNAHERKLAYVRYYHAEIGDVSPGAMASIMAGYQRDVSPDCRFDAADRSSFNWAVSNFDATQVSQVSWQVNRFLDGGYKTSLTKAELKAYRYQRHVMKNEDLERILLVLSIKTKATTRRFEFGQTLVDELLKKLLGEGMVVNKFYACRKYLLETGAIRLVNDSYITPTKTSRGKCMAYEILQSKIAGVELWRQS